MHPLGLAGQTLGVKDFINRLRRCAFRLTREQQRKSFGIPPAALETRPMTGSQCGNFVEKE